MCSERNRVFGCLRVIGMSFHRILTTRPLRRSSTATVAGWLLGGGGGNSSRSRSRNKNSMTRMCVLLAHAGLVGLSFVVVLSSSLSLNTMPTTTTPMVPSRAQDTTTIALTRMTVTRMASTDTDNEDGSSLVSVSSSSSSSSSPPQQHPCRQRNNDRRYFIHMLLRKTTVGLGAAATATTGMTFTTGIWKPGIDGASAAAADTAADTAAMSSSTGTSQQSQSPSQSQRIPPPPEKRRIIRLSSGLQFSDIRVGSGPKVMAQQQQQSSARNNNDDNNSADNATDTDTTANNNVVLMHVKALRQDNAVLFDTRVEGPPILFELGSIAEERYYFNAASSSSSVAKGRITLGIQEAILAPGVASWEGGYSNSKQEVTMRYGGIRLVVVPSELAYGQQGVSRYDAFQMKLQYPVPRNEIIRYEIELFRCNDDTLNVNTATTKQEKQKDTDSTAATPPTVRACCPEELYPCQLQ